VFDAGVSDDTAEMFDGLDFEQDITFSNGNFVRYPEGT
jgi:hypothetical protein